MATTRICAVEGCDKPIYRKEWCTTHLMRWKRTGDPLGVAPPKATHLCSVPGCGRKHLKNGFCGLHSERLRRRGDPLQGRDKPETCSIPGCEKIHYGKGWCVDHWRRWKHHGDPLAGSVSPGEPLRFIREDALVHQGEECLLWPHSTSNMGYAIIKAGDGRVRVVSRLICLEFRGPPPTPEHQAAHACGNPTCVNPHHLSWKTPSGNQADRITHGTKLYGEQVSTAKLTEADVLTIRANSHLSKKKLAELFRISLTNVYDIVNRKIWRHI